MRKNAKQKNSDYWHLLRSDKGVRTLQNLLFLFIHCLFIAYSFIAFLFIHCIHIFCECNKKNLKKAGKKKNKAFQ